MSEIRSLVKMALEVYRQAHGRAINAEIHRASREIQEERAYRRTRRTSIWDYEGFDVFEIRWMLEGRTGEIHPESDWDHPVWSTPEGAMGAYDANY